MPAQMSVSPDAALPALACAAGPGYDAAGRDPRLGHPEGLAMRPFIDRAAWLTILLLTAGPAAAAPAPDLALRGTVTAADGSPAAGAVVWAARPTHGPLQRGETRADDQGRFALNPGPGEWYVWARLGTQGSGGGRGQPDK